MTKTEAEIIKGFIKLLPTYENTSLRDNNSYRRISDTQFRDYCALVDEMIEAVKDVYEEGYEDGWYARGDIK